MFNFVSYWRRQANCSQYTMYDIVFDELFTKNYKVKSESLPLWVNKCVSQNYFIQHSLSKIPINKDYSFQLISISQLGNTAPTASQKHFLLGIYKNVAIWFQAWVNIPIRLGIIRFRSGSMQAHMFCCHYTSYWYKSVFVSVLFSFLFFFYWSIDHFPLCLLSTRIIITCLIL